MRVAESSLSLNRTGNPFPGTHRRRIARALGHALCYLVVSLTTAWASLAIYFDFQFPHLRIVAATAYLLVAIAIIVFSKRPLRRLITAVMCCSVVIAWWLTIKPSDNPLWQPDVSRTAWAEVSGDQVIIHNFRSCDYRAELDYTCQWLTKQIDLNQIRGVDFFMNYWGSPPLSKLIAHTIVSFDLGDNQHIAFSIEARKQIGQTYSSIRGFFHQYTLIEVISEERDLVRLRTNYRQGENLYLYHTRATPNFARSLFLNYIGMANRFHDHPQWYNAVTRNCTTEILTLQTMKAQPRDWRILLNGKADEMEYEHGELAGDLPFRELKQRAYINPAAQAADQDLNFSERIRENRPGFSISTQ